MKILLRSQISEDLRNRVAIAEIDADIAENFELCRQHGVLNLPFLALYRDGTFVGSITGLRDATKLTDLLHQQLCI